MRPCAHCGTLYAPPHPTAKYCGRECQSRACMIRQRARFPERPCAVCGTPFRPVRQRGRFCSPTCYQSTFRGGQPVAPPRTVTPSKPAATKPCPGCGTAIAPKRRHCLNCQEHQNVQSQYQRAHGKGVVWILDKRCPRCRKATVEAALCFTCATGRPRLITMPAHLVRVPEGVAA